MNISNFIKNETLAQVFSCEFCEIFKNTFFCNTSDNCFWISIYYYQLSLTALAIGYGLILNIWRVAWKIELINE